MNLKDPIVVKELWNIVNRTPPHTDLTDFRPYDIVDHMFLIAAHETAEYVIKNMVSAKRLSVRPDLLAYTLSLIQDGLVLEFGVFKGHSINMIAEKKPERTVHGFDSFEGLPEDWNTTSKGVFSLDGHLPEVRQNVRLYKGWFEDTLPSFLAEHGEPVSFVHVDSDLYSSAKYILTALKERLVPGSIVQFDEFFNYPNWREGEYKAFREFSEEHDVQWKPLGFTSRAYCAAFQVIGIG